MHCNESENVLGFFFLNQSGANATLNMVTWLFSTFSRAMHGLHFQLTSDWFAAFYTFVTVGSWFGFVTTVIEQFSIYCRK